MVEPTEHRRDERMVASPIPTPFSYASIDDCCEAEISFLHAAFVEGVEPTMARPHLLSSEWQEQTFG